MQNQESLNDLVNQFIELIHQHPSISLYKLHIVDFEADAVFTFGYKYTDKDELDTVLSTIEKVEKNAIQSAIEITEKTSVSAEQMEEDSAATTPRSKSHH